jgi:probable F420-dependent oxidoreductase
VLPGRHPVLVTKQLASMAWLAPHRILPVFGPQPARAAERAWFPVPPGRRGDVLDESLALLRLLLEQPAVDFAGEFFTVEAAGVGLLPGRRLDLWLGGSALAGLRRVGRLADGWLGSLLTPGEAGAVVGTIRRASDEAGRADRTRSIRDRPVRPRGDPGRRSRLRHRHPAAPARDPRPAPPHRAATGSRGPMPPHPPTAGVTAHDT